MTQATNFGLHPEEDNVEIAPDSTPSPRQRGIGLRLEEPIPRWRGLGVEQISLRQHSNSKPICIAFACSY